MLMMVMSLTACHNPKIQSLENELSTKTAQVSQLEKQIEHMQESNSSLLDRLAQLSIINQTEAESIKSSLVSLNRQARLYRRTSRYHRRKKILSMMHWSII